MKTFDIEVRPVDRFLEQAIEIRGDEPRPLLTIPAPPLTIPAQPQQCLVSGGRVGRIKVRCEDFRQFFPYRFASTDDPVLQQADGHVESFGLDGFLLFGVGCDTQIAIKLFDQPIKVRQPCPTGNTRAAEKHHAGVLVRLKQAVRNIGSVLDELHRASLAKRRRCLVLHRQARRSRARRIRSRAGDPIEGAPAKPVPVQPCVRPEWHIYGGLSRMRGGATVPAGPLVG